jgi:ferritin-like metal-binding protein YciE
MRALAMLLSLNRIGFGLAYLFAPGRAGLGWIGRSARDPATQVFVRGHGARDLALGAGALGTLARSGERAASPWFVAQGIADLADVAATVSASGRLPRSGQRFALVMAGASALAATVAAVGLGRAGSRAATRDRSIEDQLTKYLTDVHSIEVQALAQLASAPEIAGDERLAAPFEQHLDETREHERLVREALEARGADPSRLKDLTGRVGGWAMIAFARLNPDTPGKLLAHAYSYEHMELAAYELLARVARRAGDESVRELAERIGRQERAMADRLAANFDPAVEASLRAKDADAIESELVSYLRDAHAIEAQAIQLLGGGSRLAGFEGLAEVFREHLEETREQQRLVDARLRAHGARPSSFQNTAMRIGGLNVGAFFGAQPDTPAKLAGFAFAFEHLEIAAYELLSRTAERAGDDETVATAQRILVEERQAAQRIAHTWDAAIEVALYSPTTAARDQPAGMASR